METWINKIKEKRLIFKYAWTTVDKIDFVLLILVKNDFEIMHFMFGCFIKKMKLWVKFNIKFWI